MSLSPDTRTRIEQILGAHKVVLFMKGSPDAPQCGFSAKAAGILNGLAPGFGHVDVLADPEIREGIKVYGQWPTIPQLYVGGELLGGSDIIEQMLNSGELHEALGLPAPDRTPPAIEISERAAQAINNALDNAEDGYVLHLGVDPRFNARFELKPASGQEVVAEAAGIRIHLDLASVPRARGLRIDWVEDARGAGLAIHNPNAPAVVKPMSVQQLHDHIIAGTIDVVDVRPAHARALAPFPHPHEVLDEESRERLEALPKDLPLAFLCHHGNSSRQAAEYFRGLGFHDLYNVEGGIDAWSVEIDASVPRY
ncbi:Grx4 family monothiol glutaredoxin [Arenimonas terrae]|uniref:Grx4 family monothiol glutaredoxin n=1 Tax=Arenimonas terrae TaxID=2546226 RepID=A0A5C4RYJ0_9GAMM|nr:Grx4 family monothiol glutaredoxin [Arenimonas terrae]TNJ35721.1 Grx4 family monothiol glutaredoxin [Arenimonas terrae]